jgi:hypothetical protein
MSLGIRAARINIAPKLIYAIINSLDFHMIQKTCTNGTVTATGIVPHLKWRGIDLPVALAHLKDCSITELKQPQYRVTQYGKAVFVLPGGARLVAALENLKQPSNI